jgi:hypothetical protein
MVRRLISMLAGAAFRSPHLFTALAADLTLSRAFHQQSDRRSDYPECYPALTVSLNASKLDPC